ncbi:MAG: metallophosphatase family protein [Opitutales bacterium]|nr:metallophosphatase family protein [Opitutales bacterium]NRA26095.1 metallophosphoesterase family protein [Opitutales bacterium]
MFALSDDRIAIFSDVHSNVYALKAVLEDAFLLDIERHICLGDIVGYGAHPSECLEMIRELECPVVQGNHDYMAAESVPDTDLMTGASAGAVFSKEALNEEQLGYLRDLPRKRVIGDATYSHASLEEPEQWGYVFSTIAAEGHLQSIDTPVSFMGHTHVPVCYSLSELDIGETFLNWENVIESSLIDGIQIDHDTPSMINVGSVGQPRDGDPRASYVIYSPSQKMALLRRVIYDVQAAQKAILDVKLPLFSAQRLEIGE